MWFGFPSKATEHGHLKVQIKQTLAAYISSLPPPPPFLPVRQHYIMGILKGTQILT